MGLQFETAHLALAAALPELRPCIERIFGETDGLVDESPGQYTVFGTYRVWLEVLGGLVRQDAEARELARRAINFAEAMLAGDDRQLRELAMDSCAEVLAAIPQGYEIAHEIGGPVLRGWMAQFGGVPDRYLKEPEIIDLWGVREVLANSLPHIQLHDLPGITQPAEHHRLSSPADARATADGVVVLHAYGKSGMFVLARGELVQCSESRLQELATQLAPACHPNDTAVLTRGNPGVGYFDIPPMERVWTMAIASARHARLAADIDLWVAPDLIERRSEIRNRLSRP